ncbi:50S ribosomal protein L4 [bacterium]|nr:50S ribosomal protein L4 [bacterium]
MKLDVYKIDGTKSGEQIELNSKVFGIEPNDHAIWQAVTTEASNKRLGLSATKNRALVNGGGKKPWKQKGRGTARAGTIRSPLWVGGGRIFGPVPHTYKKALPKKAKRLAKCSALSHKTKENNIIAIEDFSFDAPKTKDMFLILDKLNMEDKKVLLLINETDNNVYLSGRNIAKFYVKRAAEFSTYDVVKAETVLVQKSAIQKLNEGLSK